MAIDWGLFQTPNVAGSGLQGFRAGRNDMLQMEDREHERQRNALETKRQIASEDRATQDRHRQAAARLYAGLLHVPEAQRREAALREAGNMGLPPEEMARVTGVINDPATTWDDAAISARVQFLGGEVAEDSFENSPNGLYRIPAYGAREPVLVPGSQQPVDPPRPPDPRRSWIRGVDNSMFNAETGEWTYGDVPAARPRAAAPARSGGGGRRSGGRGGGGRAATPTGPAGGGWEAF